MKNDGGPAFPRVVPKNMDEVNYEDGMMLRDYIAVHAMQGFMIDNSVTANPLAYAKLSYEMADAMLKAREQ